MILDSVWEMYKLYVLKCQNSNQNLDKLSVFEFPFSDMAATDLALSTCWDFFLKTWCLYRLIAEGRCHTSECQGRREGSSSRVWWNKIKLGRQGKNRHILSLPIREYLECCWWLNVAGAVQYFLLISDCCCC